MHIRCVVPKLLRIPDQRRPGGVGSKWWTEPVTVVVFDSQRCHAVEVWNGVV